MENGAISKADEFIVFHNKRMNQSLTALEAKGLVLDAAPLYVQEGNSTPGTVHGLIGGDFDMERVKQMIIEAHNASAAFSLLQLRGQGSARVDHFSENRDFGILAYELLHKREFASAELILAESLRRGHQHNLLIRAALCVDASRGPKKGKVISPSAQLERRCRSLLRAMSDCSTVMKDSVQPDLRQEFLGTMVHICGAIVVLGSGITLSEESLVDDTLDAREDAVVASLESAGSTLDDIRSKLIASEGVTVSEAGKLLPDSIVPVFACTQMLSKLAEIFGWGRKKQKTKKCSEAIANLISSFTHIVCLITDCLQK
jgi:hypothetical protein